MIRVLVVDGDTESRTRTTEFITQSLRCQARGAVDVEQALHFLRRDTFSHAILARETLGIRDLIAELQRNHPGVKRVLSGSGPTTLQDAAGWECHGFVEHPLTQEALRSALGMPPLSAV
ncbi:MAG: hypothetical protein Q8R13_05225 [bacterium]|nr:hypothetical protein [bacterium]